MQGFVDSGCWLNIRYSAAGGEAGGESRGEVGGEDAVLGRFEVVRSAVEVDDLGSGVEQGEGGSPIAVAGLADRAGIDHVTSGGFQLKRDRFGLADGAVFGTEAVGAGAIGEEPSLQVGMAEERNRRFHGDQRHQRVADRDDVGVLVAGRAVNQLDMREIFQGERALGESVQPFEVLGGKLVTGPDGCGGRHGIEIIEFEKSSGGFVVIAAHEGVAESADTIDHFVRRRAIADDVAKVGYKIEGGSGRQAGFHGLEISVNVAKQQYAQ